MDARPRAEMESSRTWQYIALKFQLNNEADGLFAMPINRSGQGGTNQSQWYDI